MTAKDVLQLLAARHSGDVFVPECKDGPTQGCEHMRLDAWAMRKSWAHPNCWGYEIKVTRRDFVQDSKSHAYLPLCNEFYFVAPKGLINEWELQDGVGLLVVAGSRLLCKRKAAYRDGAEDRANRKQLASLVGATIAARIAEQDQRINRLEKYRKLTGHLEKKLQEIGVDPDNDWGEYEVNAAVKRLQGDLDLVKRSAKDTKHSLDMLIARIEDVTKPETAISKEAVA